ncbi:hypothetical protein [Caldicellulosiruptor naganoensis]|uniref:Uncharacterized protein n=1 Tax=Caldicellulosiruptor naganoensis TaxID=29324 RepID=A0ABY7BDJ1_9FIRM|nr:hypothetical protein [Caldicellulosiruptor naganoensis]WAM30873.1 hypothetical protein OTJ99_001664 [Caldicellulosiruptor naganoensis]
MVIKDAQILVPEKIGLNVCYKLKNENVKKLFEVAKILAYFVLEELQSEAIEMHVTIGVSQPSPWYIKIIKVAPTAVLGAT